MVRLSSEEDVSSLHRRVTVLFTVVLVFVLIVLGRLFYLQIVRGQSYQTLSQQISVREEEVRARRGLILDRHGKVLADSRPYYEIAVVPQYVTDRNRLSQSVSQILPLTAEEVLKKLDEARGNPPFFPVTLIEDASYDLISKVREYERPDFDESTPVYLEGVEVRQSPLRVYPYSELFSHVLGYLRDVDRSHLNELIKLHPDRYSLGDLVGASGVEKSYDLELRGHDGVIARVVDARGREIRGDPDLAFLESQASFASRDGDTLVSSLDFDAQVKAAEMLGDRRGSVVALDPNTGEVLVLLSHPGFDANRIMKNIDKSYWQKINLHEDKYLYNRAIQAAYPPGSTYKVVGAYAGLDSGKLTSETGFRCSGGLQFGNRFFHCWNKGGHGLVQIIRGITQSCDTFFYNVGLKVGVDGLYEHARKMGLGQKTSIDLPFEQPGLIPSSEWKEKRFKQPWIESETLSIAIGQGYDTVTPLQNAVMIAMIANGGRKVVPHVGKKIVDQAKKAVREISPPLGERVIRPDALELIQKGLIGVVHGEGTARALRASPFKIAGKTGTAQVIGYESKAGRSERTRDHAWFVAYAPYDNPQIAVSVLVENGGHGGGAAAPIAQAVIDAYLGKK